MSLVNRIEAFVKLGYFLQEVSDNQKEMIDETPNEYSCFQQEFRMILQKVTAQNAWFTPENVLFSCKNWAEALTENNLKKWVSSYAFPENSSKKVALILAGNIPLVGFHDFLCVLLSGHTAVVKNASNDKILLPFLAKVLIEIYPPFKHRIIFSQEKLPDFDAVIATGSNNTARYFEYYFSAKPHIIRKNRNSVAVLTGKETSEELFNLGKDIFTYFGLGCRSVSKIFVPENYDFTNFFKSIFPFGNLIHNEKYANNYDYNKAVYLMSLFKLQENGFLLLKEDSGYGSPIASLFYEYYSDENALKKKLQTDAEKIQCVVGNGFLETEIPFGKTQEPQLWDYADGVDTLAFLQNI